MINYTLNQLLEEGLLTEEMLTLSPILKTIVEGKKKVKEKLLEDPAMNNILMNGSILPIVERKKSVTTTENCNS